MFQVSPHLMTPAAVGNQDTTEAVSNGLGWIHMVSTPPTAAQTRLEPPPLTGPPVWGKLDSSKRACQILGGHFHRKKAPVSSWLAATKFQVIIFTEKKGPAASWIAAAGLVKSWMDISVEKNHLRQAG